MTKKRRIWVTAAAAVCTLLAFLFLKKLTYFRWENSDDSLVSRILLGYEGGTPGTFNLYLHTVLMRGLALLSSLFPGKGWYALFQTACVLLSLFLILRELLSVKKITAGIAAAALFTLCAALFSMARLNFTTTAAMLCAAFLAQLQGCIRRRGCPYACLIPFTAAYLLRPQTVAACIPFLLPIAAYTLKESPEKPFRRRLLKAAAAGMICIALLFGIRTAEISRPEYAEPVRFADANTAAMDYAESRLSRASDEILAAAGLSRSETEMIRQWYFMDKDITAESMEVLGRELTGSVSLKQRISDAFFSLGRFFREQPRYLYLAVMLTLLMLLCLLNGNGWSAFLTWGLCAAMTGWLALSGRLLSRAADCALIPGTALLLGLAADNTEAYRSRRSAALAAAILTAASGALVFKETCAVLQDRPDTVSINRESDLERYALAHPESLILRSPNLIRDTRLLPDTSAGIPGNTMIWGDWTCRTPGWYAQLEQYVPDGHAFTGADLTRENILLAWDDSPLPQYITDYISESAGRAVSAEPADREGGLVFYRFR